MNKRAISRSLAAARSSLVTAAEEGATWSGQQSFIGLVVLPLMILACLIASPPIFAQEAQKSSDQPDQKGPREGLRIGKMLTTSSLELGWRRLLLGGNRDVYRSSVNLGEGPRLFGLSVESQALENTGVLFDYLSYSMNSWGGDPYNTMSLRLEKRGAYRFDYRYSRIKYYNFIPTYANPLLGGGILFDQHSFDSSRRQSGYNLTIFPDADFRIHLGYDRNAQFGTSFTTFPIGLDEFLLIDPLRTTTDDYRAGVDFRLGRAFFTLEQGFRRFKNDVHTNQSPGMINTGNSLSPGNPTSENPQQIVLTGFNRAMGIRGSVPTTRLGIHSPLSKTLLFTGRFVYSDANIDFGRSEALAGTLFDSTVLRYFTAQTSTSGGQASRPNALADAAVNYHPHKRLTLTNTSRFNHFDIAGGVFTRTTQSLGADLHGNPPLPNEQRQTTEALDARTFINSFFNQWEGIVAVTRRLTVRAGHRFVHRRVSLLRPGLAQEEESTVNTHVFIGGLSFRAANDLRLFSQVEHGSSDNVFTRISPYQFTRLRIRSEYRPTNTLTLGGQVFVTDSRNPTPLLDSLRHNRGFSITTSWMPHDRFGMTLSYSRSDVTSSTNIVEPRCCTLQRSSYTADDNFADGDLDFRPIRNLRIALGYSVVNSQGTFPLNFHQPRALLSYDFPSRVTWMIGWRWYGYNEKGVSIQDYRAHTLTSSLKIAF